jgi:hypothetical protein
MLHAELNIQIGSGFFQICSEKDHLAGRFTLCGLFVDLCWYFFISLWFAFQVF